MPAPNRIDLPLPFNEITRRAGDVSGWVVILNLAPNLEVVAQRERHVIEYGFVAIPLTKINTESWLLLQL
ncbi:hypothetical protein PGT21_035564 [Puccinia graminis f. sp. tritici]|uniref:Uncharacterized protein n=1 Tax=Puccinia graminis f. sp. tritici TaxID=56615 RepID=A0A5B0MQ04_PUCGR|nr:hypothetical protein PGT21_035564 [Puccinia graminis f. sp. tritici]